MVKGEDRTYTILEIELDRHEIDQLSLTFTIRMSNQSQYPANFWNASFRLLADGVPVAPIGDLNEVVDGNAAGEGTVKFAIPGQDFKRLGCKSTSSARTRRRCRSHCPQRLSGTSGRVSAFSNRIGRIGR